MICANDPLIILLLLVVHLDSTTLYIHRIVSPRFPLLGVFESINVFIIIIIIIVSQLLFLADFALTPS